MSLLLLETNTLLQKLVSQTFPPDERQDNFVPHVSLVSAPESKAEWLQERTKHLQEQRKDLLLPLKARYLSLWSTQGELKDWYTRKTLITLLLLVLSCLC